MIKTQKLSVWGREFSLPVEYDCYEGEVVTQEQIVSLNNFVAHPHWIANAKKYVEKFCDDQVMEDAENHKKDNIFSYVKPECLFVRREAPYPRIALMCKYRYDIEHGLAIVFSFDGNVLVGPQDMIL